MRISETATELTPTGEQRKNLIGLIDEHRQEFDVKLIVSKNQPKHAFENTRVQEVTVSLTFGGGSAERISTKLLNCLYGKTSDNVRPVRVEIDSDKIAKGLATASALANESIEKMTATLKAVSDLAKVDSESDRVSGRITGLLLEAMSKATLNRGEWVYFFDHGMYNHEKSVRLAGCLEGMANSLDLDYEIEVTSGNVRLRMRPETA